MRTLALAIPIALFGAQCLANPTVPAMTKGLSVVPGAIVCHDYDTVQLMFDLYSDAWSAQKADDATQGQWALMHGAPPQKPNLAAFHCSMIPAGTSVELETGNAVPVIDIKAASGALLRVVTLPGMVEPSPQMDETNPPPPHWKFHQ